MKQYEADAIAKGIRNQLKIPIGYKTELVDIICKVITDKDQFFNRKRFRDIALLTLPEGWPRDN